MGPGGEPKEAPGERGEGGGEGKEGKVGGRPPGKAGGKAARPRQDLPPRKFGVGGGLLGEPGKAGGRPWGASAGVEGSPSRLGARRLPLGLPGGG